MLKKGLSVFLAVLIITMNALGEGTGPETGHECQPEMEGADVQAQTFEEAGPEGAEPTEDPYMFPVTYDNDPQIELTGSPQQAEETEETCEIQGTGFNGEHHEEISEHEEQTSEYREQEPDPEQSEEEIHEATEESGKAGESEPGEEPEENMGQDTVWDEAADTGMLSEGTEECCGEPVSGTAQEMVQEIKVPCMIRVVNGTYADQVWHIMVSSGDEQIRIAWDEADESYIIQIANSTGSKECEEQVRQNEWVSQASAFVNGETYSVKVSGKNTGVLCGLVFQIETEKNAAVGPAYEEQEVIGGAVIAQEETSASGQMPAETGYAETERDVLAEGEDTAENVSDEAGTRPGQGFCAEGAGEGFPDEPYEEMSTGEQDAPSETGCAGGYGSKEDGENALPEEKERSEEDASGDAEKFEPSAVSEQEENIQTRGITIHISASENAGSADADMRHEGALLPEGGEENRDGQEVQGTAPGEEGGKEEANGQQKATDRTEEKSEGDHETGTPAEAASVQAAGTQDEEKEHSEGDASGAADKFASPAVSEVQPGDVMPNTSASEDAGSGEADMSVGHERTLLPEGGEGKSDGQADTENVPGEENEKEKVKGQQKTTDRTEEKGEGDHETEAPAQTGTAQAAEDEEASGEGEAEQEDAGQSENSQNTGDNSEESTVQAPETEEAGSSEDENEAEEAAAAAHKKSSDKKSSSASKSKTSAKKSSSVSTKKSSASLEKSSVKEETGADTEETDADTEGEEETDGSACTATEMPAEIQVLLNDGEGKYSTVREGNVLQLIPEEDEESWKISMHALQSVQKTGIDQMVFYFQGNRYVLDLSGFGQAEDKDDAYSEESDLTWQLDENGISLVWENGGCLWQLFESVQ